MIEFLVERAALSIAIISLLVSLVISIVYKYTINQNEAKENKKKMKKMQEKIKTLSKSGKQKEAMELQKKMSEMSLNQMKSTFKPMILSMVLVIPVFLFAFPNLYGIDPITLNEESGQFVYRGESYDITYTLQDEGKVFEANGYKFEYGDYSSKKNELMIKRVVAESPVPIPFAGNEVGWLGWYILCSIPFSLLTRKLLGVV